MGQQRVSNIALINIETAYANSVVNNNVIRIFDIFGRRLFKFRFCRFMIIHHKIGLVGTFRSFIMKGKKICIRKGYRASGKTVNTWNSSRMFIVLRPIIARLRSLRASSPGRSGGKAGKGRGACNYVTGIWIYALKKSMRNADWRRWH